MKQIERPKSLTELVTVTLREWILSGHMQLGSHLSEARLAREMQVSRTPVREAINRLEIEGLLRVEPQRGTFIFDLGPDELEKICDARVCLETAAVTAAIGLDPKGLHRRLSEIVARMTAARDAGDDAEYLALDTSFHQAFFDFSGNRFLDEAYAGISLKMTALRNRLGRHPDHMAKSFREHVEIAEAVGRADLDATLRILRGHIDRKEGSYWDLATKKV
jgi:DNA-binding GntR family transcriptional regulator